MKQLKGQRHFPGQNTFLPPLVAVVVRLHDVCGAMTGANVFEAGLLLDWVKTVSPRDGMGDQSLSSNEKIGDVVVADGGWSRDFLLFSGSRVAGPEWGIGPVLWMQLMRL
ncbi:hypothetical protein E6O75_ATG07456 [Venturia nashicola]|uniref:Uncharacterized protein n=1 Tax=Venturia nashicola TaxID=86259 RepID=A0A4Z1PDQ7_9PEZI|nr:hypothetical protein E6O75_ATG07456 [Venturia nashicola]